MTATPNSARTCDMTLGTYGRESAPAAHAVSTLDGALPLGSPLYVARINDTDAIQALMVLHGFQSATLVLDDHDPTPQPDWHVLISGTFEHSVPGTFLRCMPDGAEARIDEAQKRGLVTPIPGFALHAKKLVIVHSVMLDPDGKPHERFRDALQGVCGYVAPRPPSPPTHERIATHRARRRDSGHAYLCRN